MFLSVKRDSFSVHFRQVLSHTGLSDCWAFLCINVARLYLTKCLEVTVVVT